MSKPDPAGTNPNEKVPAGGEELYGEDDGLRPVNEDEDDPGLPEETEGRENRAGTEKFNGEKFQRD
jgi:hypothetical protein